jgi:hypothetical protein
MTPTTYATAARQAMVVIKLWQLIPGQVLHLAVVGGWGVGGGL